MRFRCLFIAVVGCGYPEQDFRDEVAAASCEHYVACYEAYDDVAACVEVVAGSVDPHADCAYDPGAARDCVTAWEELACAASQAHVEVPAACDAVYDCG